MLSTMKTSIALPIRLSEAETFTQFRLFWMSTTGWVETSNYKSYLRYLESFKLSEAYAEIFGINLEDIGMDYAFPEAWPPDLIADYLEGRTATAA
jgi:hypothetical protein